MSAAIIRLRRPDDREDPWHARLGLSPFRETFPLWERSPASLSHWLAASTNEFPVMGMCQVSQRRDMPFLEDACRRNPEASRELLTAYIGLHSRFGQMARALHGEAMRLALADTRANSGSAVTDESLMILASLDGQAVTA